MNNFNVGDKIKIATKTHVGAIQYQGKEGKIVGIHLNEPKGYDVILRGESKIRFFLDWEVE